MYLFLFNSKATVHERRNHASSLTDVFTGTVTLTLAHYYIHYALYKDTPKVIIDVQSHWT